MHKRRNQSQYRRTCNNLNGHPMRGQTAADWPMRRKMELGSLLINNRRDYMNWPVANDPKGYGKLTRWQDSLHQLNFKKMAVCGKVTDSILFTNRRREIADKKEVLVQNFLWEKINSNLEPSVKEEQPPGSWEFRFSKKVLSKLLFFSFHNIEIFWR